NFLAIFDHTPEGARPRAQQHSQSSRRAQVSRRSHPLVLDASSPRSQIGFCRRDSRHLMNSAGTLRTQRNPPMLICSLHCIKPFKRLLPFIAILTSSLAHGQSGYTVAPWTGPMGVTQRTDQIMDRDRQAHQKQAHPHTTKIHPRPRPDFQNLRANPDSPSVVRWPPSTNSPGGSPQSPQSTSVNFLAATLAETE